MLKNLLGALWRNSPKSFRRWSVRLIEPRFAISTGAVVADEHGRVLLLKHVFRVGSGWGIPGGFMEKGEQPEDAIRRELREEVGLELESARLVFVRTLKRPTQVEIMFHCRPSGRAAPQSVEVKQAAWFEPDELPPGLSRDQRHLIERVLGDGAKGLD